MPPINLRLCYISVHPKGRALILFINQILNISTIILSLFFYLYLGTKADLDIILSYSLFFKVNNRKVGFPNLGFSRYRSLQQLVGYRSRGVLPLAMVCFPT